MKVNEEQRIKSIREQLETLPSNPGVYQYFDKNDTLIYVGKAKNLKRRVSSYFNKEQTDPKTKMLVSKILTIKHFIVKSEQDALLLENNLIKKYKPRYNILLKDDKTYPWIMIKNEHFPRILLTRQFIRNGSQYFGPYANVRMAKNILMLIKQLYKPRTCSLNLNQTDIAKGKFNVCLEYHIKNCNAPCVSKQAEAEYNSSIEDIRNILRGNIGEIIKILKQRMLKYSAELRFEEAGTIKEQLKELERYQSHSTIVNPSITNIDVYSILDDNDNAYVNFLKVVNGAIVQLHTLEIKRRLNESAEELLGMAITEIRQNTESTATEIIVPFLPDFQDENITFHIPQRGEKLNLLHLSEQNAQLYKVEKIKRLKKLDPEQHTRKILEMMQKDLQLSTLPTHMECFDNSNIQGAFPVASCVVFRNAKPSKNDYRHFNIKTVVGPDDFASMEEILTRRYQRLLNENEELPNLVIVDGGKGQLSSAVKVFKDLGIFDKVPLIGIAKRFEEIFFPNDPIPLYLDRNSITLKIIQQMRDEAHRFGITHHRNQRSRHFTSSELENITGIGPKTIELLFKKYKSISVIKESSEEELSSTIGKEKARNIKEYFELSKK